MTDKADIEKDVNERTDTGKATETLADSSPDMPTVKTIELYAVVDRIEDNGVAVLSVEDEAKTQMDVPLAELPKRADSEGDHLLLKFDVDTASGERKLTGIKAAPERRAAAADRIAQMQERLARMSGTEGKKDFNL